MTKSKTAPKTAPKTATPKTANQGPKLMLVVRKLRGGDLALDVALSAKPGELAHALAEAGFEPGALVELALRGARKMTVAEAGQKGGRTVAEKYGEAFFKEIGKKGGDALVEKRGPTYYSKIGKKGGQVRAEELGSDGYSEMGRRGGRHAKAAAAKRQPAAAAG